MSRGQWNSDTHSPFPTDTTAALGGTHEAVICVQLTGGRIMPCSGHAAGRTYICRREQPGFTAETMV